METLGGWHSKAVEQIRILAKAQGRAIRKDEDEAIRHLFLVKGGCNSLFVQLVWLMAESLHLTLPCVCVISLMFDK